MKNYKQKRMPRFKTVLIALSALILLGILVFFVAFVLRIGPFSEDPSSKDVGQPTKSIDYNPPTSEQSKAGDIAKQQNEKGLAGSDPTPPPKLPSDGNSKSLVGMEVTAANVDGDTLYLRAIIQTVSTNGTCTLTATGPNSKTYSANAGVQAGPSTSTCQGFNIPVSSLSSGTWKFLLTFENDTLKASASTEKVL